MPTAPQNSSHQALYRACMKEAAAQGRMLMRRLVARAAQSLPRSAAMSPDEHERRLLTDAARTLMKHEVALCEAYPQALLGEFARAIAGDPGKSVTLSFDSLELMGEEQMQESVELMRLQQSVLATVEAELSEFNALVCAIQGLSRVDTGRNPLRPEGYVRSLRSVAQQSPVPTSVRTRWMRHLGDALGPELACIYRELSTMLRSQGVVEARFSAVPMPEAPAVKPGGVTPQASALLNLQELRRLLGGEFDSPAGAAAAGGQPGRAEFSATVPAAFEALQEMKQVEQVMQRLRQRQADGEPNPAPGAAASNQTLHGQARRPGQALGQEVVKLMVETIANDARLLPPVQQAVRALEPAMLRLALDDPRFFSARKHPARGLLDQMTQRSLAWESMDAPGFAAFLEPLLQAVDALTATHVAGPEPFAFALQMLEDTWNGQQQRDRNHRAKAVRALLRAEQRNLLAERVSREMRRFANEAGVPREIGAFLVGPWSQVMAQARLSDSTGASDPGGYADVVSDLSWSAQPGLASTNIPRLMKLIPPLVAKLREGLALIDYPGPSTKRFLDGLADTHRSAMKASSQPAQLQQPIPMAREELEKMFAANDDNAPAPWLAPTEAQDSGFMETHSSVTPRPLFAETQPVLGDSQPAAGEPVSGLAGALLPPGAWVEMLMEGGWGRYQVTWASPHGTLFMFASAGGKPHSMTWRLLDKMREGGSLRMISGQAVVDGALDAVAQAALRNSLDLEL